jgi:hypothetical protein
MRAATPEATAVDALAESPASHLRIRKVIRPSAKSSQVMVDVRRAGSKGCAAWDAERPWRP